MVKSPHHNEFKQHRRLVHKPHTHQIKRANTITLDDVKWLDDYSGRPEVEKND